jgi:predicted RNA-binding Zn-ribbon protein involved in translation (DUF1610 family)
MIECDLHGIEEWEEDFACENCGKAYFHDDPDFPDDCSCGVRLKPHSHETMKFSARAICPSCASRIKSMGWLPSGKVKRLS